MKLETNLKTYWIFLKKESKNIGANNEKTWYMVQWNTDKLVDWKIKKLMYKFSINIFFSLPKSMKNLQGNK